MKTLNISIANDSSFTVFTYLQTTDCRSEICALKADVAVPKQFIQLRQDFNLFSVIFRLTITNNSSLFA